MYFFQQHKLIAIALITITIGVVVLALNSLRPKTVPQGNIERDIKNAMIVILDGEVELQRDSQTLLVRTKENVLPGDTISTRDQSKAVLVLQDNSTFVIEQLTTIRIPTDTDSITNFHIPSGRVFSTIRSTENKTYTFSTDNISVFTPHGIFDLLISDNSHSLFVTDGTLSITGFENTPPIATIVSNKKLHIQNDDIPALVSKERELELTDITEDEKDSWIEWNISYSKKITSIVEKNNRFGYLLQNPDVLSNTIIALSEDGTVEGTETTEEPKSPIYIPQLYDGTFSADLSQVIVSISNPNIENIDHYDISFGSQAEKDDLVNWIQIPAGSTSYTFSGLVLHQSTDYYINIYSVDRENWRSFMNTLHIRTPDPPPAPKVTVTLESPVSIWSKTGSSFSPIKIHVTPENTSSADLNITISIYNDKYKKYWDGNGFYSDTENLFSPSEKNNLYTLNPGIYSSHSCEQGQIHLSVEHKPSNSNLFDQVYNVTMDNDGGC